MASIVVKPRVPTAPPASPAPPTTQCPPPCPACGGLECLCRPRFFPGQVLTDDDLNRLENYVTAKNRLHNRYFHGAGVVCGLEVVCDACNTGNVTVSPGYALSPCGDDIIVCNAASVYICDLINQCKPRQDNCDPYAFPQPVDCKQGIQQWVLSICYQEQPSRGVQPLMSQPCGCNCQGGCSGGCGCGGTCGCTSTGGSGGKTGAGGCGAGTTTQKAAASMSATAGKYNAQCEPTLICEGFSFTATRYVDPTRQITAGRLGAAGLLADNATRFGPLLTRLIACYLKATQIRDAYANPQLSSNINDVHTTLVYSEFASALQDFASEHLAHRCDLARQIACLDLSAPAGTPSANARPVLTEVSGAALWQQRFNQLNNVWLQVFRDCICSAFLPPCPDVTGGNCVPLAVVTVNADTCTVLEICNWWAREFALTLPTLYYWTSFINWGAIKDVIANLCCGTESDSLLTLLLEALGLVVKNNAAPVPGSAASVGQIQEGAPINLRDAQAPAAARGKQVSPNLSTVFALSGLLQQASMPDGIARLLSVAQPSDASGGELADLKATVATMQKTVAQHKAQIARLAARGNR